MIYKTHCEYFVLWNTPNRGIHTTTWNEFKKLIRKMSNAEYAGFENRESAQKAYTMSYREYCLSQQITFTSIF